MAQWKTLDLLQPVENGPDNRAEAVSRTPLQTRIDCLEQILRAFHDIADRDDIHQAAERLSLVREWIENETERAAADPIFVDLRLVGVEQGSIDPATDQRRSIYWAPAMEK